MKRLRRPLALGASTALHAAAITAVIVMAGATAPPPLFVDLTRDPEAARDGLASARGENEAPRRPAALARQAAPPAPAPGPVGMASPGGGGPAGPTRIAEPGPAPASQPADPGSAPPAEPVALPVAPPRPEERPLSASPAVGPATPWIPAMPATGAGGPETSRPAPRAPAVDHGGKGRAGPGVAGSISESRSGGSVALGAGGAPLALAAPDGRGGPPPEYGPYLRRFRERVHESLRYPLAARRQRLAGTVELEVLMEPNGRIRTLVVVSSSHPLLDEAAVEAVRSLPPLPLPEHLPRRPLRIRLPLVFELR